mmetsp:Transcript_38442/g.114037  ORF Transcript_38442/g.114037 Transcript_38442/m.114037 type:complete len:323 (+) Transcript_38442:1771-2739(+)
MSGDDSSRRARATRRRSPPERLATSASAGGHRSASMACSMERSISHALIASSSVCIASILRASLSMSAPSSAIAMLMDSNSATLSLTALTPASTFSPTVAPSLRSGSCSRYPILIPGARNTFPSQLVSRPDRMFMRLDLPLPLAPRMPILAPRYMPRLMFLSSSLPLGATLRILSNDRMILRVSSLYAPPDLTCFWLVRSPASLGPPPPPPPPELALPPPPPPSFGPFFRFAIATVESPRRCHVRLGLALVAGGLSGADATHRAPPHGVAASGLVAAAAPRTAWRDSPVRMDARIEAGLVVTVRTRGRLSDAPGWAASGIGG